jgi:general secretion pathway protein L
VRDTLYLQLRDAPADVPVAYAVVAGPPGASIPVQHGSLDEVLAQAGNRRIVLFVPGADVRLTTVQVPARQAQKVLQAAPYALEDQLAEDVDTLHFAIAGDAPRRRANEPHPVAIVARERMDAWLAPLRARQLRADAVVPETLSLPAPEAGRWTGLAEAGRVTIRTGAFTGFTCTLADLEAYLQLADPPALTPLRLFVANDVDYDFTRLARPIELMPGYGSALEVLVRHWRADASIDLLQGAYSQKPEWQGLGRPWRIAAGVAAAWLVVALANGIVETVRGNAELRRLEQANIERYKALFPETTRFDNLALQAQQQLLALRGAGGGQAPLLQLLDAAAASLGATPGLTLQSLQFRDGALFLSLTGTDLQALESLRAWYGAHPSTQLSVQDTNASPDGVQIRLKLTLA